MTLASRLSSSAVTLLPGTAAAMCCSTGILPSTCSLTACATCHTSDSPRSPATPAAIQVSAPARTGRGRNASGAQPWSIRPPGSASFAASSIGPAEGVEDQGSHRIPLPCRTGLLRVGRQRPEERLRQVVQEARVAPRHSTSPSSSASTASSRRERGLRNPTVVTLFEIAQALGVTPVDLIGPDEADHHPEEPSGNRCP